MREAACLLIGYLFGCFLTAAVVVKGKIGRSVFEIGSGNPGMANVMANVGKKEGFLVLAGDILKTVLAAAVCSVIYKEPAGRSVILWSGLGAVLGHNYPVWHRFRGGKGVTATITTLILAYPFWGTLLSIAGGALTVLTGDLWLGAVLIPLAAVPAAFLLSGIRCGCVVLLLFLLAFLKNAGGVIKVIKGEEHRRFRSKYL